MVRIPINNKTDNNGARGTTTIPADFGGEQARRENSSHSNGMYAGSGNVAEEMEGPAGADVSGGDLTPEQDAGASSDEHNARRIAEGDMQRQQAGGEVDTHQTDLKPSSANPDGGLPPNPHGSESGSNAPDETATEGGDSSGDASASDASAQNASAPGNDISEDTASESTSFNGAEPTGDVEKLAQAKAQLVQLAADFDNYKKLAARRESEVRERAVRGVLEDLLPVLDNFERAVKSTRNARDVEAVRVGVEYILKQFQETLSNHGVQGMETQGQPFDPRLHDALEQVPDSDQPAGTIVGEVQRGYTYRGEVLRPSRVRVAAN